jgi:hypothetical protein
MQASLIHARPALGCARSFIRQTEPSVPATWARLQRPRMAVISSHFAKDFCRAGEKRNSPLPRPAREPSSGLLSCGTRALLQSFRLMPVDLIKVCIEAQDRKCLSASISCVRETQLKKDQLQWLLGCRHSGHSKCLNPQDLAPAPSGDGAHQRSVFRNATTHGTSSPIDVAFHSRSSRVPLRRFSDWSFVGFLCM